MSNPRLMRPFPLITLIGALALLSCRTAPSTGMATAANARTDTLPQSERLRLVDAMAGHVRSHFAHWGPLGSQSLDSMVRVFREAAAERSDRWAFDSAALAFAAGLRNGHTRFSDQWLWETRGATLWLQAHPIDAGWMVTMSEIDSLRVGDVIQTIDGVPVEQFYQQRRSLIAESGERARRRSLFYHDFLFPSRFDVVTDAGRRIAVVRGQPASSVVAARRAAQPLLPHRWLIPDSIAYLRVRRFSPRSHEDSALAVLAREYASAPALVVDVRGNGGGNTPIRLMAALRGDARLQRLPIERSTIASDRLRWMAALRPSGTPVRYRGVLTILADGGCGSACDDFVAPFAAGQRATVIGDTTWGSTGQPRMLDLGSGMTFQVSARRYTQVDRSTFEGVGIAPHEVVRSSPAELLAGVDAPLLRAIASSRERLQRQRAQRNR